ncbi:MAG: hypothetical protein D6815_13005 [Candidatus Dadabacteria bacterium]|nr:MAG: hypothetical protein D6815_13005 [Candidatus Dadabacteria bacterium]
MGLIELWRSGRAGLADKRIDQILAIAGDGRLRDGGTTSREFRAFLGQVPSDRLREYAGQCLAETFPQSGFVLQDIVNEIGVRLGFEVEPGRYRGKPGEPSGDGLWRSEDGRWLVVEVKTTDAYRIRLEKFAERRRALVERQQVEPEAVSGLIVVGRQDTGGLEAQIRGSRFAWDMRLISVDALSHLVDVRESLEDARTARQIRDVLFPREFTRLDAIVALVFWTKEDLRFGASDYDDASRLENSVAPRRGRTQKRAPAFVPVQFHEACVARVERAKKLRLRRQSRSVFVDSESETVLVCRIAKTRQRAAGGRRGWGFFFAPTHRQLLQEAKCGWVALGCGSEALTFLFPGAEFLSWVEELPQRTYRGRKYSQFRIVERGKRYQLRRGGDLEPIDITSYRLPASD